jgi:PAS domain S-box-containing protein
MTAEHHEEKQIEELLETPDLASALESERFRQFLDHVPFAVAVSELHPSERIVYANLEFERVTGLASGSVRGKAWRALPSGDGIDNRHQLRDAITDCDDYIGSFSVDQGDTMVAVHAWSNVIEDDGGTPMFRLVTLSEINPRSKLEGESLEERLRDKDALLLELQHRVKNNLQMITALVRHEARNLPDHVAGEHFERLAGRIEALALLYRSLSDAAPVDSVDLGVYLSQIASAVMTAHAREGIHLDLRVDTWPVSINVAMPAGLVVNELLTNSLKHAFAGRDSGTIILHSLVDDGGCRVIVADDGIGFPEGVRWPRPGHLAGLIVQSLRSNAKAQVTVDSASERGVRVTIFFARADATPDSANP